MLRGIGIYKRLEILQQRCNECVIGIDVIVDQSPVRRGCSTKSVARGWPLLDSERERRRSGNAVGCFELPKVVDVGEPVTVLVPKRIKNTAVDKGHRGDPALVSADDVTRLPASELRVLDQQELLQCFGRGARPIEYLAVEARVEVDRQRSDRRIGGCGPQLLVADLDELGELLILGPGNRNALTARINRWMQIIRLRIRRNEVERRIA